jgi:hypothetical protein
MKNENDYFGFSLWHDLFAGNLDWMQSMAIDDPASFDPEEDGWDIIFSRLDQVLKESGLEDKLGGCFHVSREVAAMHADPRFHLLQGFERARKKFTNEIPFELGMHCKFGAADLPLAGNYPAVLAEDLQLAGVMGATCIVCHPPKGLADMTVAFVQELTSDRVIDALSATNAILAWENEGPDCFFGSLAHLLTFRESLAKQLDELGRPDLVERHLFCLDTGHLLYWRDRGTLGKSMATEEIDNALPFFAQKIKVFHIHSNDGTADQHLIPGSFDLFDHPTRANINREGFAANSQDVTMLLEVCERCKGIAGRHVHVEALRLPFTLSQVAGFGREYESNIKKEHDEMDVT